LHRIQEVLPHGFCGTLTVSAPQGVNDTAVLLNQAMSMVLQTKGEHGVASWVQELSPDREESIIACRPQNHLMKLSVETSKFCAAIIDDGAFGIVANAVEPIDLLIGQAIYCFASPLALQHLPQDVPFLDVLWPDSGDDDAFVSTRFEPSLNRQAAERLTHWRSAHAQPLTDGRFDHARTRSKLSGKQGVAKRVVDLIAQR
jgi:hypothetical protein